MTLFHMLKLLNLQTSKEYLEAALALHFGMYMYFELMQIPSKVDPFWIHINVAGISFQFILPEKLAGESHEKIYRYQPCRRMQLPSILAFWINLHNLKESPTFMDGFCISLKYSRILHLFCMALPWQNENNQCLDHLWSCWILRWYCLLNMKEYS